MVSPSLQPKFVYWVQVKSVKPGQREVVKPVSVGAVYEWNSPLSPLSHDGEFLHLKNTSLTSVNTRQHSHMMVRSSSTSKTRLSPLSTFVNTGQVRQVKGRFFLSVTSAFCETRAKLPGKPPGLNPTPPGRVRRVKGKPPRQTSRASQASLGQVSVPTFTCFYLLIDGSCLMDLMDGRRRLSVFHAAKASFLCIAQGFAFLRAVKASLHFTGLCVSPRRESVIALHRALRFSAP